MTFFKTIIKTFCIESTHISDIKFGIIGLHACGDLTAILMKIFADCKQAKLLCIVGCCYEKLSSNTIRLVKFLYNSALIKPYTRLKIKKKTPRTSNYSNFNNYFYVSRSTEDGYPLSRFLKNRTHNWFLSYKAKEIACHAQEIYCKRLKCKDYTYLKVIFKY